jgi:hypothetical protein
MTIRKLSHGIVACALLATPLAFAAPAGKTVVIQFKTASTAVYASAEVGGIQYSMTAQNYDDMDGVPQAFIAVDRFDYNTFSYSFIVCSGSAYANTVLVNKVSGASSVVAYLDPAAAGCYGFNSTPVTVNLSGTPTGGYSSSEAGSATTQSGGGVWKSSFQSDVFDENFSGSIGFFNGALSGRAETAKVTQRTRVK